ncbi:MAG TPA: DUF4838 domain-containing protein [Pirellulales bacterium]|nr:DUF4838 domain-containing protein [Pirellulales bacterium]
MKYKFREARAIEAALAACLLTACAVSKIHAGTTAVTTLVRDGTARCVIVVPAGKQPIIQPAAEDLQYHLRKMSGAEVAIVEGSAPADTTAILLGVAPTGASAELTAEQVQATWPDGYLVSGSDRAVALLAARPEGVRNAVYGLLEDYLGCRWFTPGEIGESIPNRTTIEVKLPSKLTAVKPSYELRGPWYNAHALSSDGDQKLDAAAIAKWGLRNRGGGLRGSVKQDWATIFPKELQEKEPGLQAMIGGKRTPRGAEGQVCMSYPRATAIALDYFTHIFTAYPQFDFFTFSPNDNNNYCQCPECMAMGKNAAERVLRFSNAVAEGVNAKFPGKGITLLPYAVTIDPPTGDIRGAANLYPLICSFNMEQVKPKTDENPSCTTYRGRVAGWMKILPRAWSYDYIGWYPGPWPLFKKLEAEQHWYQSLGFSGTMPEYLDRNMGTDVHMWLSWKLAWDKRARVDKLLVNFYPRYYGPAAPAMRSIYEAFERQMLSVGGTGVTRDVARLYPVELVDESLARMARAKQSAKDETITARIERDENCLKLLRLFLDAVGFGETYRKSGSPSDKARVVEASEGYLRLADGLRGTLTVGGTGRMVVKSALDAANDPGTVFGKPGPFSYQDYLDDGGKVFLDAKSRRGFTIGVYGLYLKATTTGEVVYDIRTGAGLKFKDARLFRMYMSLPAGGHNSVEISTNGGQSWAVAYRDVAMSGDEPQYDLTQHIAGTTNFLLKLRVEAGRQDGLAIDNWGIRGDVE